jgi:hypothetical protein
MLGWCWDCWDCSDGGRDAEGGNEHQMRPESVGQAEATRSKSGEQLPLARQRRSPSNPREGA